MDFTKITYKDNLGKIPARINRDTGELMLNSIVFPQLPNYFQHFIKLHEYGHYLLQTKSENNANAYAIENFVNYDNNELFSESVIQLIEIFEVIVNNKPEKLAKYYSNNPELIPAENESDITGLDGLGNAIGQGFNFLTTYLNIKTTDRWNAEAEENQEQNFIDMYSYDLQNQESESYTSWLKTKYFKMILAVLIIALVLIIYFKSKK